MFEVFIGSSKEARNYAEIVEAAINVHPLFKARPWWTAFKNGKSTYEQIIGLLSEIDFAIFLTTPDDKTESREKTFPVSRANVLLEYGIFTGHLGSENALRLHIGETTDPSDLYGVVSAFARIGYAPNTEINSSDRIKLESAIGEVLADLLNPSDGGARLDIEFMRARNYHAIEGSRNSISSLLESQQFDRLCQMRSELRDYNFLPSIIKKHTVPELHEVGINNHTSVTKSFVDFSSVSNNTSDELLLSHAFSHYVAGTLLQQFADKPPSRFAIPDSKDQLPFLAATLDHLRAKPAVVRPRTRTSPGTVQGRFFGSERSVLLQGVTSTGNTPSCCSVELHRRKVRNVALFSFIAKSSHIEEINSFCRSRDMAFYPMLLQHEDGNVTVAAGQIS